MSTHIGAKRGQIAKKVLLPGDPLRAEWIAKNFLKDVTCYSKVRNMFGFTGISPTGERVSVQGAGMGQASMSIYVNELIRDFHVEKIIRVGTAGSLQKNIPLKSIIIAQSASTDSSMVPNRFYQAGPTMTYAPIPSWKLLHKAVQVADQKGIEAIVGGIVSTDSFYEFVYKGDKKIPASWEAFANYGAVAIEMESSELFTLGAQYKIQTATILMVSDHLIFLHQKLSAEERQTGLSDVVRIALEI
ncbi:MAG: purine-nucleoside phosphorylase [Candidatus Pacebacteria bacterium]|nr:purine-nucleoside phosphorylase [Candidatus Paceibacterota bacterium]MBP9839410.1 purine-nucleoside phosphorylase [Candidatus Paceibacterota bacterium]